MDELPQAILVEDEVGPPGNEPLDVVVPEPPPRSANWLDLLIVLAVAWSVELVLAVVLVVAAGGPDLSRVPLGLLAASLIGWAVTLSVAWLFVCRKYGKSFAEGFAVRGVAWWLVLASVAIGVVASVLATLILSALPEGESLMTKLAKQPMGLFRSPSSCRLSRSSTTAASSTLSSPAHSGRSPRGFSRAWERPPRMSAWGTSSEASEQSSSSPSGSEQSISPSSRGPGWASPSSSPWASSGR